MPRAIAALAAALTLTAVTGCGSGSTSTAAAGAQATPPAAATASPAPAASATPAASASDASTGQTFTGQVAETMNAGGYTYMRLENGGKTVWAAALEFPVKTGERVTVPLEMPMAGFTSKTLNRTFPVIYFVSSVARDGETLPAAPAASAPAMAASHGSAPPAGSPGASTPPMQVEKMAPPKGGLAIADVWAQRKTLGGTRVTISGKVVKVNNGILGHNWIHLQDGSGSEGAKTHDLTVTTDAEVKLGDVVTATGTLTLDKDFGAGYAYDAILEGATVTVAKSAY